MSQKTEYNCNLLANSRQKSQKLEELRENNYVLRIKPPEIGSPKRKDRDEKNDIGLFTPDQSKLKEPLSNEKNIIAVPQLSSFKKEQPSLFDSKYFQTIIRSECTSRKGLSEISNLYSNICLDEAD